MAQGGIPDDQAGKWGSGTGVQHGANYLQWRGDCPATLEPSASPATPPGRIGSCCPTGPGRCAARAGGYGHRQRGCGRRRGGSCCGGPWDNGSRADLGRHGPLEASQLGPEDRGCPLLGIGRDWRSGHVHGQRVWTFPGWVCRIVGNLPFARSRSKRVHGSWKLGLNPEPGGATFGAPPVPSSEPLRTSDYPINLQVGKPEAEFAHQLITGDLCFSERGTSHRTKNAYNALLAGSQ